ncbi:MAG: hybrid sensor histidine kinase/response regulator [Marinilabiliales bacterium]|nr:MAG: hybrid sensor histidine kinase/response regulator [Marinilabiliales bacterium]
MDEAELIKRLRETFKIEAEEHSNTIIKGLIELEKNPDNEREKKVLEEIYRSAHSLKGASRAVNLPNIEKICQALESCFSLMKNNELQPSPGIFDIFHSVLKTIDVLLDDSEENPPADVINRTVEILNNVKYLQQEENDTDLDIEVSSEKEENVVGTELEKKSLDSEILEGNTELIEHDYNIDEGDGDKDFNAPAEIIEKVSPKPSQDTIRLSTKKLDDIYLLAEESLQIKISHDQESREIKDIQEEFEQLKGHWLELYSEIYKTRTLENKKFDGNKKTVLSKESFELYDVLDDEIKQISKKIHYLLRTSKYVSNTAENIIDNLVDEIKHILMVPFTNLMNGFPRMVRNLSKDMKKEVQIDIKGDSIEVDRRIMEELKDPLIHIIRNCIDHGIETPAERIELGKSSHGNIELIMNQIDANHVQIEIMDDGSGIDKEKVKNKALRSGILSKDEIEKLDDKAVYSLVFKSGLSTASIITDISGRGLGLAIVEEKIEKLGGKVQIESETDKGSKFTIIIPTTISKSQGLLVRLNTKHFIIPVSNIIETLRIKPNSIKKVENKSTIQFRGNTLPLIHLSDILEQNRETEIARKYIFIVAVESMNQRVGLIVDDVLDEQEVLFKKLGFPLIKVRNVAGVSLLGNGEICPILNNHDIIRTAFNLRGTLNSTDVEKENKKKQKSIIIAEDSITSRLFIKNILESAGYKVKATVDGKEAFTSMKQEKFDLLVSDVEMPRMNGFELTQSVRKDKKLKDMPIVLVTSLNNREDQEKGIEVGANAYIVKSSFEQSNLLEVVKKLI